MTDADAEKYPYNPFDLTKVWPHGDFPLIEVGMLELNENPENYHAEVEQASFSPSNIVPGISWSPDKMLQARIFAYADAHRYRVGTNYEALPVNRPTSEVNNYIRDGSMRFDGNGGDAVNYEPNSFNGPAEAPGKEVSGFDLGHVSADRFNHRDGNDDYTQPGDLFRLLDNDQQGRLMDNIAEAMDGVPKDIIIRQVEHFYKADPDYGIGVATRMGLTLADIPCAQAAE